MCNCVWIPTKKHKKACAPKKMQLWLMKITLSFKKYLFGIWLWMVWMFSAIRTTSSTGSFFWQQRSPTTWLLTYVKAFDALFSFDLGIYAPFICLLFVQFVEMYTQICVLHHFALIYSFTLHPSTFNSFTLLTELSKFVLFDYVFFILTCLISPDINICVYWFISNWSVYLCFIHLFLDYLMCLKT